MKRNTVLAVLIALAFASLGSANALARGNRHGTMGGDGPCMGPGFTRVLDRMSLSKDQEHRIAGILKSHRDEIARTMTAASDARSALRQAMHATEYSEPRVKEAAADMAAQHEAMILLKGKIMSEVRSVLTPEQNRDFQDFGGRRGGRGMEGRMDSRLATLDRWIADHSQ
ncbi:MAG: Spy/CpxP family protein refolding chaperone [Syntrophobacteraceae bacterium]|jgi:Spy/CpxP family protein refolding chaperone|nr:Spy/CpxP family protein refolding chaperone [Syntrophobacteraceae bacterium]